MSLFEIILLSVGLAMDAFAVAICKGLETDKATAGKMATVGAWFGIFQGAMPAIGYFLGTLFAALISTIAPYVSFVILLLIGINMIKEAFETEDCPCCCCKTNLSFKVMFGLAVATSIDALAVGVTFALSEVNVVLACSLIAGITFIISAIGYKIGNLFGSKYKNKAEFVGGIILIGIGTKFLIEGLITLFSK